METVNPTAVIEYQVRPVTRYLVTRYDPDARGSVMIGEFNHVGVAEQVGIALRSVTPGARFYSSINPGEDGDARRQVAGILDRKQAGDSITVDGKAASIWGIHEWISGQRIFDVIFNDDTPPARVLDVQPYTVIPDSSPTNSGDLSDFPPPGAGPLEGKLRKYSTTEATWVDEFESKISDRVVVDGMPGRIFEMSEDDTGVRNLRVKFDNALRHPAQVQEVLRRSQLIKG